MSSPSDAGVAKMRAAGLDGLVVETFRRHHERLSAGETGSLPENEIAPVEEVPDAADLPEVRAGDEAALNQAIVIKLNGGLGTSMGMTHAKSLIEAKDGLSFLDITARQVLALRDRLGARLPLVLMNGFHTREDSLDALRAYPELDIGVPLDFVQNKVPKLDAGDLCPVEWPANPELEWAPPGHGDLYTALSTSGLLATLLEAGYRYAFVANADNLGARLDPRILAWIAREEIPFCLEVADRTEADRKGGHLARRPDGGLLLREVAQTPDEDMGAFQDISRHRYFNTNSLWIDLHALTRLLDGTGLALPMIVNRKTVDPSDRSSPAVLQLETAMGAAIDAFPGARALRVDRTRFAPVKTTDDLLVLRSDAYELTGEWEIRPAAGRTTLPVAALDPAHYKLLADFEARFPAGPPSLLECDRLTVTGDVRFGAGVVVRGKVQITGPTRVPNGTVLAG